MAERKKQHYVPKLYLRNFTSNGKYISIYNITKEEAIPHVPYDTQCYKDYYYGKDLLWETHLGTLETEWGAVFQKILSNESLTDNELNLVRQFAMYQLQRTAAINKYLVHQREEFLCEYGRLVCQKKGIPFDSDAEKHCKERAKSECSPAETLALADKYLPLIQDLSLLVIKYKTNQSLISSDVPVIAINQFHQPSIGYSCMGLIILFPITSNILVVLYDGKMYPKYKDYRYISINNESEVSNLNILQVISADKILFAKSEYSFSQISSKAMNARIVNRSLDNLKVE